MKALALMLLVSCSAPVLEPVPIYQPDEQTQGQCPEDTDQASYAYFCDDLGGISGCMAGTEPSMCDQATSTRHDCDCDNLTTCQSYRDASGYAVVGCIK